MTHSDAALKEYLVWLDKQPDSKHFIISQLDAEHLFIINAPDIDVYLQGKVDDFHDSNSYSDAVAEAEIAGSVPSGEQQNQKPGKKGTGKGKPASKKKAGAKQ